MTEPEVLDISELCTKYPRRWMAVRVLSREEDSGQPARVEVITANADMYSARLGLDKQEYCILYTGPIPEEKHVLMY